MLGRLVAALTDIPVWDVLSAATMAWRNLISTSYAYTNNCHACKGHGGSVQARGGMGGMPALAAAVVTSWPEETHLLAADRPWWDMLPAGRSSLLQLAVAAHLKGTACGTCAGCSPDCAESF